MISATSILVDVAWGLGVLILGVVAAFQVRSLVRKPSPPEASSPPPAVEEEATASAPGIRKLLRCPQCTRKFEVLLDPAFPETTVTCPTCSYSADFRLSAPQPPVPGAEAPSAGAT